ncbi:MAG: Rne/Rng family ribonuclease [Dermatophilus congolensis]|nr:Rne/Rng family ribonuclease [Dermatophilus congolensis]
MASEDDFDAPAPRTRRTRRAVEPQPEVEQAVEETKPARARRTRTRKPVEAPVEETPVVAAEEPAAEAAESIADTESTEDATDVEAAQGADESDETQDAVDSTSAEDTEDTEDTEDAAEAPAAPALPTFGLIFQAPDPSVAVRRSTRRADAFHDSDESDDDSFDADSDGSDDSTGADSGDAADSGEPTGRRRRSRRSRGSSSAQSSGDATSDAGDFNDSTSQGSADGADDGDDADSSGDGDSDDTGSRRSRRRGGRGRRRTGGPDSSDSSGSSDSGDSADESDSGDDSYDSGDSDSGDDSGDGSDDSTSSRRRTRRRRRSGTSTDGTDDPPGTVTRVREPRSRESDTATGIRGSTRLEAKRQRRRDGREAGRRRTIITEAQFLARRESVERVMAIREVEGRTEIGVLEDGVLVEHYISGADGGSGGSSGATSVGNVYLGRVQNVLPSMEAAFVDIGKGRNAVLYAGEVNWDAAGLEANSQRRIENALTSGQSVLVQVTKDPIGHKGARLTSQVSLPGRFLVYVPDGSMTGISRKLPDNERARLKGLLKKIVPENAGVIVRTAAEGASEEELTADVERLARQWERIQKKSTSGSAPVLLHGEPGLTVRVVRDVFNEDFSKLVVAGDTVWETVSDYVESVAPDLMERVSKWTGPKDLFAHHRIDEQLAKAMDRKVWLPSGGSLVIDRTEAMTVIDVNTGKFTGSGGNLEETVTKNNLEAAEEIVNQLRLRDIGGIIVVDFIDMVLESNRDLVVRRLVECLGRDRTKHQVAEVTSLGLVQMTRKRVGSGLIEVFSEPCDHCSGRGIIVHDTPRIAPAPAENEGRSSRSRRGRDNTRQRDTGRTEPQVREEAEKLDRSEPERKAPSAAAMAAIAAVAKSAEASHGDDAAAPGSVEPEVVAEAIDAAVDLVAEAKHGVAEAPAPARRTRRGGRRAASAPSGVELSSVGLMTASTDTEASTSAPLTQVAGDATVVEAASADATSDAATEASTGASTSAPTSSTTSRRKPRRRAGSPAGPPAGPEES